MFGDWVKEQRLALDLTQQEMATLSGIPQTTISGWETRKVEDIRISKLVLLSRFFSVRLCDIPLDNHFEICDKLKAPESSTRIS